MANYSSIRKKLGFDNERRYFTDKDAYFTHFLQSPELIKNPFYSKAVDKYITEKGLSNKAEELEMTYWDIPFPPPTKPKFTFIDLFAGIGGIRLAFQELGGKCVFSSEWDKFAQKTYEANFGEVPFGDIRHFTNDNITDSDLDKLIPDHDILTAGFPCQPFSLAGVSARNYLGREHGFDDIKQGNLFFDIVRIVKVKRPKALFLENVKNLRNHDNGRTFQIIKDLIEGLGYSFNFQIINAQTEVPQRRERTYMVCYDNHLKNFEFPKFEGDPKPLYSILEKDVDSYYTISDRLWLGHKNRSSRNIARGTGFSTKEAVLEKPANTLVARYYKDGKECLIPQDGMNPRKLTPRECARLQGFPEKFKIIVSDSQLYKQFGNSVAVPVIRKIARELILKL